jgi:SAM-dependent methyltransferase
MRTREYEDEKYWNNLRRSRDHLGYEHVALDGSDGEKEFDHEILNAVVEKRVLDLGCGVGLFTLEIARGAREAYAVDFSREALFRAKTNLTTAKQVNVGLELADARKLPFTDATFDVVVSRRGPGTATMTTLYEAHRVLLKGGRLMEITIGEKDKANIAEIFGRGQNFGVKQRVAISKDKMLREAGFRSVEVKDYVATEIFSGMEDLIIRLSSAPIIPDFDVKQDSKFLLSVEKQCKTRRGIETEVHRVTIVAVK